jgi:hypothetical protein
MRLAAIPQMYLPMVGRVVCIRLRLTSIFPGVYANDAYTHYPIKLFVESTSLASDPGSSVVPGVAPLVCLSPLPIEEAMREMDSGSMMS